MSTQPTFIGFMPFAFPDCQRKGANVTIAFDEHKTVTFNIWCDLIETDNPTIRVCLDGEADHVILTTVEAADYTMPTISFSEPEDAFSYAYLRFNDNVLHIKIDDEGVIFDVWDDKEPDASIDSGYELWQELFDLEDEILCPTQKQLLVVLNDDGGIVEACHNFEDDIEVMIAEPDLTGTPDIIVEEVEFLTFTKMSRTNIERTNTFLNPDNA